MAVCQSLAIAHEDLVLHANSLYLFRSTCLRKVLTMRLHLIPLVVMLGASSLSSAVAQELRAVTEDGRKVVLFSDGKWQFDSRASTATRTLSESPYQTAVKRFSLVFNPDEWRLLPKKDDEPNRRSLQHKSLPVHALVIADEIPARTETLKDVILYNAKSAGASTTILVDKTESLGSRQVGSIRFAAMMKGMELVFSTYYYADEDGNVQVSCFTGQSLFFKYQGECQKLLNGLAIN